MSGRPFQVGDTVRITDHIKRATQPDLQHVFEGVVSRIDPKSGPESPYTYAPYLWIDTDPFENASGETFTATFCSMTEDLTDGDHPGQRSIELLEAVEPCGSYCPLPLGHDGDCQNEYPSVPALVQLDRDDAADRVLTAALAWETSRSGDSLVDLAEAVRGYRESRESIGGVR